MAANTRSREGWMPRSQRSITPARISRAKPTPCFMYMRHTAHIQLATLREQSSTVLLIPDLAPAAKGCFRFCTPGQQMLPKNLFMGEMHPQNASQLCSMRPTDGSKHGQGMLQVTVHLFLLFRTPPRVSWGRPKSERPCSQVSWSAFSEVPASSNESARRGAGGTEKAERRRMPGGGFKRRG